MSEQVEYNIENRECLSNWLLLALIAISKCHVGTEKSQTVSITVNGERVPWDSLVERLQAAFDDIEKRSHAEGVDDTVGAMHSVFGDMLDTAVEDIKKEI